MPRIILLVVLRDHIEDIQSFRGEGNHSFAVAELDTLANIESPAGCRIQGVKYGTV